MINITTDKDKSYISKLKIEAEKRESFESHIKDEIPKLINIKAVLAYEYFNYGWEAAAKFYSKEQQNSNSD